jgi:hypothetical protein
MEYFIVAIIGAGVALAYWAGVDRAVSAVEPKPASVRTAADIPPEYHNAIRPSNVMSSSTNTHPKGTLIAGVPWQDGFVVTTVQIRNIAPVRATNVELTIEMDRPAFRAAQVTSVPDIYVTPIARGGIGSFEAGSFGKDGKVEKRIVATPEQMQTIKAYSPTTKFLVKAAAIYNDVPIEIVFLGAGSDPYTIDTWTFSGSPSSTMPSVINLTGSYEVRYDDKDWKLPVAVHSKRNK